MTIDVLPTPSEPSPEEIAQRYGFARDYLKEVGARVRHFRHTLYTLDGREVSPLGGLTVAYRTQGKLAHISTAICSDEDRFNYKLGTAVATERLANNQFILIPLMDVPIEVLLDEMFLGNYEDFSLVDSFAQADEGTAFFGGARGLAVDQEDLDELARIESSPFWEDQAVMLVHTLVARLGGTPQEILDGLSYLLEDADEQELVDLLVDTPVEHLTGSSVVLSSVRSTAQRLLTTKEGEGSRMTLIITEAKGRPAQVLAEHSPFDALSKGLADLVNSACAQVEQKLEIKKAFEGVPAADLLSALRGSPHAAAAAAFLARLKKPGQASKDASDGEGNG